jgi:hypothetical protein
MKINSRLFIGFIAAYGAVITVGAARTVDLVRSGFWTAFGGTAEDERAVCGMIASGDAGRSVTIKWFKGDEYLTLQVFKSSWAVPAGMQVDVVMQIDGASAWQAKASGIGGSTGGTGIEFRVSLDSVSTFTNEIRYGRTMNVWFPSGTETAWTANLTGSAGALSAMIDCMKYMSNQAGGGPSQPSYGDSQPYGGGAPQPYDEEPDRPKPAPQAPPIQTLGPPGHRT